MNNFEVDFFVTKEKSDSSDLCDVCSKSPTKCQCAAIAMSNALLNCLADKAKLHNSINDNKVSVAQLKLLLIHAEELFRDDARNKDISLTEYSLAYVCAYLKAIENNLTGVVKRIKKLSSWADIKFEILEEDISVARKDVSNFKLNISCDTFESLYLDDEKRLKTQIAERIDTLI